MLGNDNQERFDLGVQGNVLDMGCIVHWENMKFPKSKKCNEMKQYSSTQRKRPREGIFPCQPVGPNTQKWGKTNAA